MRVPLSLRKLLVFHFIVAIASAAAAVASAESIPVQEFPPAVVIEGAARERGRAYGKEFREPIREFLDKEIYEPFVGRPSTKEQLLAYAAACGQAVRRECPLVAEEFEGIAEGAGMSPAEIVLINLHEELYHRRELPQHGHCTAVAVGGSDSGNAHAYVGQTWDWMESVAGKSRITEWRRGEAPSVLAYGFPGMPVGAGMNSQGIALCWTSAALGGDSRSPKVGIPSYMLIAHLLAQSDIDSVVREAKKNHHAGWFTFVMADGKGELVNIEGAPGKVAVERHDERLVRVDYGSREMRGARADEPIKLHERCQRMYDLLSGTRGKNDLAQLQAYFADSKHQINVGRPTIDLMVFDTTARRAYLSRGPSYGLAWREFAFGQKR